MEVAELDQYLEDADINPHSHHVAELLESDELYVTSGALKSNKFSIEAKKSDDASLNLNIPEIQAIVGGASKYLPKARKLQSLRMRGKCASSVWFSGDSLILRAGSLHSF